MRDTLSQLRRSRGRAVFKHDLSASISVFFVALPLCLGVSLASNAPLYTGLIAGVVGGLLVPLISRSALSVSGPAAGLTAICAAIIGAAGSIDIFFLSVMLAGIMQMLLGACKLGGFTHFIPSAVIKGMLAAIGILLVSKQIPLLIGYDQPDFWTKELFNIFTFDHGFEQLSNLYSKLTPGAPIIALSCIGVMWTWKRYMPKKMQVVPLAFVVVIFGSTMAWVFAHYIPALALHTQQYVHIPNNIMHDIQLTDVRILFAHPEIWTHALIICFVASLETLLSITAIDKLDDRNRITPQNTELIAQGAANLVSGGLGGLPITAVIVRSSANAEAGAQTKLSAILHGIWLLLAMTVGSLLLNYIPFCVLAVLLLFTGYALAKPALFVSVYRQGSEQFMPFIVTFVAILMTDLLIGVGIGVGYAVYFLIKHTYRAGYTLQEKHLGHQPHYIMELALNVSFLNKKRIMDALDKIPAYAVVEVIGTDSVYIDRDVLEVIEEFKAKAHLRHIQLILRDIPSVELMSVH